jgi:hypothetical protein
MHPARQRQCPVFGAIGIIIRLIVMVLHPQRRRLRVLKNAERHLWIIFAALIGIGVLTLASYAYLTGGL